MREQLGPRLYPANAAAVRRCVRARKPPPIILWSIGIVTCLLFLGSAALIAVGYLNPFGTVGLSILGVGAVVYFGAIIFLVLSCLWVERKYPGMQPLSFKFYSRKPQRPTPTAFVNPNISGQTPQTTPSYRIHNEIPSNETSVSDSEEITENIPSVPKFPTENKNEKQNENDVPEQVPSTENPSTAQQSLEDEGPEDTTKETVPEDVTKAETNNQDGDTNVNTSENSAGKTKSNDQNDIAKTNTTVQNEKNPQNNQKDYNLAKTSNTQNEGNVQQKTLQLELPIADYPGPEMSTPATSNIKEAEAQTSEPQDTAQQRRKLLEHNLSDNAVVPSISQEESITKQKETHKVDVSGLSSTREQQSSSVQQNSLQTVNAETDKVFEKKQNAEDIPQTENNLQRKSAIRVRKQMKEPQSLNIQDTSQEKVMGVRSTDSALVADGRKLVLHSDHDTVLQPPKPDKNIDLALLTKTSPVHPKKRVQFQEHHLQSVQPSQKLVKDNSKVSSVIDANNILQHKNDRRHRHHNKLLTSDVTATTKHLTQNSDFQGALPVFTKNLEAQKTKTVESPERRKQLDSPDRAKKPESNGRARKLESPGRAWKPESPERAMKLDAPRRARNLESTERARKQEAPERAEIPESPGRARKPESPERARKPEAPERTKIPESPARTRKPESPERARQTEASERANLPESPGRARKPESPGKARKPESPERARKPETSERAKLPESPGRARKPESPGRARKPESPGRARKQESPGRARKPESPERAMKPESPERARKLKIEHKLSHSPPNVRTSHHQNISPKAQRHKDYSIAMTSLSTSKEELYRRRNYYSSPSSQSSDHPSSTSSSPPRHEKRSPDLSQKLSKHHASGNADFYMNAKKEKIHDRHSQQSSPSSYSSDVPSSSSSSPQRHRRKDPDISNKPQRHKEEPKANSGFSSNTKNDDSNKRPGQQSSQSNDVTLSTTMSPTNLLQYKLEQADVKKSSRSSRDPLVQTSGASGEHKHQTNPEHLDHKPRTSAHSRELSPTAARTSPRSNKRFPANPRDDQA